MSDDEKLQLKKDKWWEVREKQVHIECLRSALDKHMKAMHDIAELWEKGTLIVEGGRMLRTDMHMTPLTVNSPPMTLDEMVSALEELGGAQAELERLEKDFNRLLS